MNSIPAKPIIAWLTSICSGRVSSVDCESIQAPAAIKPVSAGFALTPSNGDSGFPTISRDGRYIAFVSDATNLVRDDANGTRAGISNSTQNFEQVTVPTGGTVRVFGYAGAQNTYRVIAP